MLPLIAVLHVRHRVVRQSGAVLATIAGTSAVIVGLAAAATADLRPAALFVLGMWWWTIGKMWVETRAFSATVGLGTALLGALALAGAVIDVIDALLPGIELDAWQVGRSVLGIWLVAIAVMLARERRMEQ